MEIIRGYDNWKLASPEGFEAEEMCENCEEPLHYGDCLNANCHCQECGEARPELDNGDIGECENCTE